MDYERDEDIEQSTTIEVIRLTLKIYGSVFLGALSLFIVVRPRFPLCFNFNNSVKEHNTKLSRNHFGHVSWIWKIFKYNDDEIFESCGLTAISFLRFLRMGIKVCGVGILNSFFLIPVNLHGCDSITDECNFILDRVEKIGLGHLSQNSMSLIATTFAAYTIFGSTMYFIYNEFEWFTAARHKFLSLPRPENYSVYVAHIPKRFRGDAALLEYFKGVFDKDVVLQANIALDLFDLERKVAQREKTVHKLEHVLAKRDIKGIEPTHLTAKGELILSIPFYTAELEKLNDHISGCITAIEKAKECERKRFLMKMNQSSSEFLSEASHLGRSSHIYPEDDEEETEEMNTLIQDNGSGPNRNIEVTPVNLKPLDEIITPNNDSDEHRRDISELPINLPNDLVLEPFPIRNLNQAFLEPLRESDEMITMLNENNCNSSQQVIQDCTSSQTSNDQETPERRGSHVLVIDALSNGSMEKALSDNSNEAEKDTDVEVIEAPLDLSDLQNDPFFGLLFDVITNEKRNNHEDSRVKKRAFESNLDDLSTSHSIIYDNEGSSCGTKRKNSSGESICDDDASSIYVERKPSHEQQNSMLNSSLVALDHDVDDDNNDDASSVYVEKQPLRPALSRPPRPTLFKELSHLTMQSNDSSQDEPSLYVVLDNEANKSFISDLRRELRRDASCRSLFSDSSGGDLNGTRILVDSSVLKDGGTTGRQNHSRTVTFDSVKTSLSSASKKTKGTIRNTIHKTSTGVKKSIDFVHGGVKTSATAVHSGAKKSVFVVHNGVKKTIVVSTEAVQDTMKKSVAGIKWAGAKSVKLATNLIRGSDDGRVRDGGFVSFTSLTAKAQCVQMLHHPKPFLFTVADAPAPKQIYWQNVGLPHKSQQIGFLAAQLLTAALCLFWTFPVAFVSSLSEIDSLKKMIPSLEKSIELYPWIQPLLNQLNPILIVILKMLLPKILERFCQREGHISKSALNASLLTKLALFLIIQIFFVPAISGGIFAQLPEIIDDWRKMMELLATSVPGQVKSFIQFVIVNVFITCSLELLRVLRVIKAFIRSKIAPDLTENDRTSTYLGLEPLTEAEEMDYPLIFAEVVLYFMIVLVYSCIAPIMSFVMMILFILLLVTYQNQFIYVYSSVNDQGGLLWPRMVKMLLFYMIIAEVTLIGIMSIKQSAISSTLLVPLAWCTVLFGMYLQQQHYNVTNYLPSTIAKGRDVKNHGRLDTSFLKDAYMQPALMTKILLPEDFNDEEQNPNVFAGEEIYDETINSLLVE
eukprot:CAMPEP_0203685338 /NCGR_PEP_ID=MMETSP0090-20130426/48496_1 /ASSEMBLY_ACC=CAM_ASM_001088 /TAXON_ID=426623 /ORGANISM="Chaetoceros affinis, Strain CCMP159" /LENGTH=1259 /DNA_ID=CAMNT_0050554529 /DNA_START=115 /DNA_END=3894 /DNA_ORIENTATION=-